MSAEYELERDASSSEHTVTPRLVLSRDVIPDLNTTLNIDAPVEVDSGSLGFGYALGVRYPARGVVRVGGEWKQQPGADHATLFPQLWFALPHEVMVKTGLGIGFGDADPRFTARIAVEVGL